MSAVRAASAAPASTPSTVLPPRAAERDLRRDHLSVVPGAARRAARGPFIALLAAILAVGLLALLALNTVLAKGSFAAYDLRSEAALLADREQALLQQVAAAESPEQLESAARGLGMVPAQNPVFLRLADGKVLGVPAPATAPPKPKPAPKPAPTSNEPSAAAAKKAAEKKAAEERAADKKAAAEKKKSDGGDA